jgi:shikimate dehydrogenase
MREWHEWKQAPKADYAVVGDPVSHSLSPKMQNQALKILGRDETYTAVRVHKEEFGQALDHLKELGYKGLNVTVPLKQLAYSWAQSMPRLERRMGVVNTLNLQSKDAINTDAPGFIDTLRKNKIDPQCNVLLLGAGGTARALALILIEHGANLCIWNRTRTNLDKMLDELRIDAEIMKRPDPSGCQIVLNTTSVGLDDHDIVVDWHLAPKGAVAYDVFYTDGLTRFLFEARNAGLKTIDGRQLLAAQGARSLEWWTGTPAPYDDMLEAVQ